MFRKRFSFCRKYIPIFFANISWWGRCARIDNEMGWAKVDIDHRRTVESRDVDATKNGRLGWHASPRKGTTKWLIVFWIFQRFCLEKLYFNLIVSLCCHNIPVLKQQFMYIRNKTFCYRLPVFKQYRETVRIPDRKHLLHDCTQFQDKTAP
jgi:hypothetical protein